MAVSASPSTQSVVASAWSQTRVQQAQRNAERAEREALSLQTRARAAQASADRAEESARNLEVQSDQAWDKAGQARQGVSALRSAADSRVELGVRAERALASLQARDALATPVAAVSTPVAVPASSAIAKPVINTEGQATGTVINVTA